MMIEYVLSFISAGGITTTAAYFIGKNKGHDNAIEQARAEAQRDLKTQISMRDYDEHVRQVPGHICGQTCFEMMKVKTRIKDWKENPYNS